MFGVHDPPRNSEEPAESQEPGIETDRKAIKKDLQEEEVLEKDLLELEREAEALEKTRERRKAILEREEEV